MPWKSCIRSWKPSEQAGDRLTNWLTFCMPEWINELLEWMNDYLIAFLYASSALRLLAWANDWLLTNWLLNALCIMTFCNHRHIAPSLSVPSYTLAYPDILYSYSFTYLLHTFRILFHIPLYTYRILFHAPLYISSSYCQSIRRVQEQGPGSRRAHWRSGSCWWWSCVQHQRGWGLGSGSRSCRHCRWGEFFKCIVLYCVVL